MIDGEIKKRNSTYDSFTSDFSFSTVDSIPQAAKMSSPRERRMVEVTLLLVK